MAEKESTRMSEKRDDELQKAEALACALDDGDLYDPDNELIALLEVAERVRASAGYATPLGTELRSSLVNEALPRLRSHRPRTLYWVAGALAAAPFVRRGHQSRWYWRTRQGGGRRFGPYRRGLQWSRLSEPLRSTRTCWPGKARQK